MATERTYKDGLPYYCKTCGVGLAEVMACEDGDCEMESAADAQKRAAPPPKPEKVTP